MQKKKNSQLSQEYKNEKMQMVFMKVSQALKQSYNK